MMNEERIRQIWPDWQLQEQLDGGTFGIVYRASHRAGTELQAAVKLIEIPQDAGQTEQLRRDGLSEEQIANRYRQVIEAFSAEIRRMDLLKGISQIVSVEDYRILPHETDPGCTICIRMELLKTLRQYTCDKQLAENEVIQLGIDICRGLEICHENGILHLDVKPDNIFVNDRLCSRVLFKLGDFGASRELILTQEQMTAQGTMLYMAPEVYRQERPDARTDLYSLGLTLYRLMNHDTMPFLQQKQFFTHDDLVDATRLRLLGHSISDPDAASGAFAAVIQKACAWKPEDRYANAREMRLALEKLLPEKAAEEKAGFSAERKRLNRVIALLSTMLLLSLLMLCWLVFCRKPADQDAAGETQPTKVPMILVFDRTEGEP